LTSLHSFLARYLIRGLCRASTCALYRLRALCFRFGARFTSITQFIKFFVRKMLNTNERILRGADSYQFIELDLDRGAIAILRVLNQKNH